MTGAGSIPHDVSSADANILIRSLSDLLVVDELQTAASCVCAIVREAVGSDGATFVLSEEDQVYYAEEDAVGALWKGRRFPAKACISGWAVTNRETAVIERIYEDPRIPAEAYRPTFVQSLCMTPMGKDAPVGAVGAYWSQHHRATEREVWLLERIAEAARAAVLRVSRERRVNGGPQNGGGNGGTEGPESREGRLLAVMAHDLRQPLSTITQGVELLLMDERMPHRDIVERMARGAGQATELVRRAAELTELASGGLSLHLESVSLDELCREVAAQLDPARRRIVVQSGPVRGLLDGSRLREAIGNLVGNALQHGDPERPVTVRIALQNACARIDVHNYGIPIAPDRRQTIFQPFKRFSGHVEGSMGLGLYIADQITRAHGGGLEVRSDAVEGTTFTMTLPVAATTLAAG